MKPGDLVYYISLDGVGELGMYLGILLHPSSPYSPAVHRVLWTHIPDDTSQETEENLMIYRKNFLKWRADNA
jgi:hypothetical protein